MRWDRIAPGTGKLAFFNQTGRYYCRICNPAYTSVALYHRLKRFGIIAFQNKNRSANTFHDTVYFRRRDFRSKTNEGRISKNEREKSYAVQKWENIVLHRNITIMFPISLSWDGRVSLPTCLAHCNRNNSFIRTCDSYGTILKLFTDYNLYKVQYLPASVSGPWWLKLHPVTWWKSLAQD